MTKITTLSLILLILFSCGQFKKNETPEKFGKSIIECFNKNDYASFNDLVVNKEDLDYLIEITDFPNEEDKNKVISTKNERLNSLREQNEKLFNNRTNKNLKYISCEYTIEKDGNIEYTSNFQIIAKLTNKETIITFQKIVKTKNGWKSIGTFEVE